MKERQDLTLGSYTDRELANAVFIYGNSTPSIESMIDGSAIMPIVYLTAAKERIRWLSDKLDELTKE